MTDMLVKLYNLEMEDKRPALAVEGIAIKRAMAFDKTKICAFVRDQFDDVCPNWVDECELTLSQQPTTCIIAVYKKSVVGFCCWDASAKGMLGPLGVAPALRSKGVARALLRQSFEAMKEAGYAYAIIGWVSSIKFYENACDAIAIPESHPGIYSRLMSM